MNRSLAAKAKKARQQSRDFAIDRDLGLAQSPRISKDYARWEDGQAHLALPVGEIKYVRGRRYRNPATAFLATEAQANVLRTHETSMLPLGVFSQDPPKFIDQKVDEEGEIVKIKPLNAATVGGDWARRTGAKIDVGMTHVLRYYDMIFDQKQAQARLDRADQAERNER